MVTFAHKVGRRSRAASNGNEAKWRDETPFRLRIAPTELFITFKFVLNKIDKIHDKQSGYRHRNAILELKASHWSALLYHLRIDLECKAEERLPKT